MTNKYNPIINIYGKGRPILAIVGCLHGDEPVGKKVIDKFKKIKLGKGTLITIIANPAAFKKKKRFIEQDLNRSFPGKKYGKIEEVIAYKINKIIRKADYVIDIHSTSTNTRSVAIVKKYDAKVKKLLRIIHPKRVVLMPKGLCDSAMGNFYSCISFEYGKHNSKTTYQESLNDTLRILIDLGIIRRIKIGQKAFKTEYYKVFDTEKKPKGFVMKKTLKNFVLIEKGQSLGKVGNRNIFARESFYPVLFGEKSYKDIMGFKAKK